MNHYKLKCDQNPDFNFTGDLIGQLTTSLDKSAPNYSGSPGRWSTIKLYKTLIGGKYVCQRIGYSAHPNEHTVYHVKVCNSVQQVKEFFGANGNDMQAFYQQVGIK